MTLHDCHVLAVGSLSSFIRSATFRFAAFRYTTSLRSFHPPQHRTQEKLLQSFQECQRPVPLRCPFRFANAACCNASQNLQHRATLIGNRTASLHSKQFFSFPQSLPLSFPPHLGKRYVLFFSATCLPQPTRKQP